MADVVLPSGMAGELRGLKGKEANHLGNQRLAKQGRLIDKVLGHCWLSTSDVGKAYSFATEEPPPWEKMLVGDRMFAFIQSRIESYGPDFAFRTRCKAADCRNPIDWEIKLDQLPVRELSADSADLFKAGNRFPATIPSTGSELTFKLLVGADTARAARARQNQPDKLLTTAILLRTVDVEGVDRHRLRAYIEDLELSDLTDLLDQFDEHDCGIETAIEIACPHCFLEFEIELPFGNRNFFLPSKATERRLKERRERLDSSPP